MFRAENATRRDLELANGRGRISTLQWGDGRPDFVFLHGRGQNAYTWTSVVAALGRSTLAVDLPGHGNSDWRTDHDYGSWPNADAIAPVIARLTTGWVTLVGMSLGGTTAIRIASQAKQLIRRLVVVDASPAARRDALPSEQRGAAILLDGPAVFDSFEEMLSAAAAAIRGRSLESLRAPVRRNARQLEDGRWTWLYDPERPPGGSTPKDRTLIWRDLAEVKAPVLVVRAGRSGMVLDEDIALLRQYQPELRVETIDSGHSVQSEQPQQLASLIGEFSDGPPHASLDAC